jgi:hypothetical protein
MRSPLPPVAVLGLPLLGACTVTRMGAEDGPPRVQCDGLIEGHAAWGLRAEEDFFRLQVLDGSSPGALAEVVLWKLFRLEVGALGVSLGLGPVDLALGTLFYEPRVPDMMGERKPVEATSSAADCEICAQARAAEQVRAAEQAQPPK